jgi:hypothetical protein
MQNEDNTQYDTIKRHWGETTIFLLGATLLYGFHIFRTDLSQLPPHDVALFTAWCVGVVWLFRSAIAWIKSDREQRPIEEVNKYFTEYCERPIVRYSLALMFLCAGIWISGEKPHLWWFIFPASLLSAYFAREVAIVGLVLIVGILLFKGIASLPVSVAIVLGAMIIAGAIRR